MLSVTFCGATRTVTGSQYYLEYVAPDGSKFNFCLDSGMFQVGQKVNLYKLNSYLVFDPKKLDCIVLTHAHLDHCGRIPYLIKMGFGGKIYSTLATKQIAEVVMRDSARHNSEGYLAPDFGGLVDSPNGTSTANIEDKNSSRNILPALYTEVEVDTAMGRFVTHEYLDKFRIHPNLEVEFHDAGHILGSAFAIFTEISSGKQVVFSGDLGNEHKPIIEDPEMPATPPGLTHIFTETTYGNRVHPKVDTKQHLREIAKKTLRRGGKLIIPSFSVERAQEVIYYLVELMREGKIDQVPIYLDSPMASKVLEICLQHPELYDREIRDKIADNANPLRYKNLKILETVHDSKTVNDNHKPCILIAGSGMLNGGRILKHLQFHLNNPLNTLLFVGYQAEGTLGRKILEGAEEVEIEEKMVEVLAQLETMNEFSAHADSRILKNWVLSLMQDLPDGQVPTVFLMHGEKEASLTFGKELENSFLSKIKTYWPRFSEKVVMWE
jgi:metallo-beta-lactamase family protein